MEYKVLSGPFNAAKLESDLDGHAAVVSQVRVRFG
jgi:hypothetical protein